MGYNLRNIGERLVCFADMDDRNPGSQTAYIGSFQNGHHWILSV